MCTVSFIPARGNIFITSNRDEKNSRGRALAPTIYDHNGSRLVFPKDGAAGGTWIAIKENGDAAVLLNGAFLCHVPEPPYRKSRGRIFLDVFATERPSWSFSKTDLSEIEPFTLVLFEKGCLYEFRWDGTERYCRQLSVSRPYIWSSATLYDGLVIKKREQWFASFLNSHPQPTQQDILHFHRFSGEGDTRNDLLMQRDNTYSTVSITGIMLNEDRAVMKYIDLNEGQEYEIKTGLLNAPELL
ncbi:MAG: NRDE family protein [Chitinophagaceae bacterium]|nr:NRDE family protein [Chitinophagaceae bacterium]